LLDNNIQKVDTFHRRITLLHTSVEPFRRVALATIGMRRIQIFEIRLEADVSGYLPAYPESDIVTAASLLGIKLWIACD